MANLSKQQSDIIAILKKNLNTAMEFVVDEAKKNTPEDTKTLVNEYEIEKAQSIGGKIKGKVKNDTPYAFFIEFGTSRAKVYHKPKGTEFFKSGEYNGLSGVRMLTRAVDENGKFINNIIKNG